MRGQHRLTSLQAALAAPLVVAGLLTGPGPVAAQASACESWTGAQQPPSPGTTANILRGVAVLSACNAWAVGSAASGGPSQALIEHWNGTSWRLALLPSSLKVGSSSLISVRAASPASIWAVGSADTGAGSQALILHWNGTRWARAASPRPGTSSELSGVSAVSGRDAWAVGDTTASTKRQATLILHWNGTAWKRVPSLNPGGVHDNVLNGVTATSASNAWAVGDFSNGTTGQTLVLRWNGTKWRRVSSPNLMGSAHDNVLNGVTATAGRNAWAVGFFNNGTADRTLVLHWNGTAWTHVPSPTPGSAAVLLGVAAASASNAWAVGVFADGVATQAAAFHCC